MNNSKIYFRTVLVINALFWLAVFLQYVVYPLGGRGLSQPFNLAFFDVLFSISYLSLLFLSIASSFFWGGWLLFRLGLRNRSVWFGIVFGLISLTLVGLMYLRLALFKGPNLL